MFKFTNLSKGLIRGVFPLAILTTCLLLPYGAQAMGEYSNGGQGKQWRFHGVKKNNNANASTITKINKYNVNDLELHAIYNIDVAPPPPGANPRAENAVGSGVAVSRDGFIYVPTTDGRIHILYANETDGVNPDGTKIPKVKAVLDLLSDPYTGGDLFDGDDLFVNRMQPALSGSHIFAANYDIFFGVTPEKVGVPLPFDFTNKSAGAILYQINRHTGELKRKIVVDDNPHSMILNTVTVHQGIIFVALSSQLSGNLALIGIPEFGILGFPYLPGGADPFLSPDAEGVIDESKSGALYRNALVAIDKRTGEILWKTYVMPESPYRSVEEVFARNEDNEEAYKRHNLDVWNGGSSWGGGNYPIDKKRRQIYIGTGEAYNAPLAAIDCEFDRLTAGGPPTDDGHCLDFDADGNPLGPISGITNVPANSTVSSSSHPLASSVVAFDYETGKIKWARRMIGFDVWNIACIPFALGAAGGNSDPLCPYYVRGESPFTGLNFSHKDMDVGEQPMLIKKVRMPNGEKRDLLIATSKKALVWALDPDNGEIVWGPKSLGEGSLFGGGILWGSATDGRLVYTKSTTSGLVRGDLDDPSKNIVSGSCPAEAFTVLDPEVGPQDSDPLDGGIYAAFDAATGDIVWERCLTGTVVDPTTGMPILDESGEEQQIAGFNEGPLTVANGVVYAHGAGRAYGFDQSQTTRTEYVALNARTGELIKRFPLNADGEPSAYISRYQRPTVINNMLILGNGLNNNLESPLARRLVIYKLSERDDEDDEHDLDDDDDDHHDEDDDEYDTEDD